MDKPAAAILASEGEGLGGLAGECVDVNLILQFSVCKHHQVQNLLGSTAFKNKPAVFRWGGGREVAV